MILITRPCVIPLNILSFSPHHRIIKIIKSGIITINEEFNNEFSRLVWMRYSHEIDTTPNMSSTTYNVE